MKTKTQIVDPDPAYVELALLDVVDARLDGSFVLNADFVAACRVAFQANPRDMDEILPTMILARALGRGLAEGLDVDALAVAALEIAATDAELEA